MQKGKGRFEEICISVLFVIALLVVTARGVIKYIAPETTGIVDEISQYLYCYMAFLSLGYCVKYGKDLSIKLFPKLMDGNAYFNIFYTALYAVCYGVMLVVSVKAFLTMGGQATPAAHIPQQIIYLSAVIGFALGLARLIQNIVGDRKTKEGGKQ